MIGFLKKLGYNLKYKKITYLLDYEEDEKFIEESLQKEKYIGIDTEFNWRNTYFPQLSLLQISTSSKILLIDCLKRKKLGFLKKIFEDKTKTIIMHSSRSDTTVLNTNLKIKLNNCFDIQIAEKLINGGEIKNYAFIVAKYFGYELDKSETNSNWLKRPISKSQISYAANDVRFLIDIFKKQQKILEKMNLLFKAKELTKKEVSLGSQDLHISRLRKFKSKRKIEENLFMWRENAAIRRNVPPSFIFKDKYFKKILKINDEGITKHGILNLLKNEDLANDLIKTLKQC